MADGVGSAAIGWRSSTTSPIARSAVSTIPRAELRRPLFLEGEAGVGKTAVATAVAAAFDTELIRLQCYEGSTSRHAVYEWDHARQILELRIIDATGGVDRAHARRSSQRGVPDPPAAAAGDRSQRGRVRRCC